MWKQLELFDAISTPSSKDSTFFDSMVETQKARDNLFQMVAEDTREYQLASLLNNDITIDVGEKCPVCGDTMVRTLLDIYYTPPGTSCGWRCDNCKEGFHSKGDIDGQE